MTFTEWLRGLLRSNDSDAANAALRQYAASHSETTAKIAATFDEMSKQVRELTEQIRKARLGAELRDDDNRLRVYTVPPPPNPTAGKIDETSKGQA